MIVDAAILIAVRSPMIRHLFHLAKTDNSTAQQYTLRPLLQLVSHFVTRKAFHPRVVRLALDGQPAPQAVTRPKSQSRKLFGFRRRGCLKWESRKNPVPSLPAYFAGRRSARVIQAIRVSLL
jgi:hypothetical protein